MTSETNDPPFPHSYLFTVRLWPEELDDGQIEWRGQVQYVLSEETRYFREWAGLIAFLQKMLPDDGTASQDETTTDSL